MALIIDGVKITSDLPDMAAEEVRRYVEYVRANVEGDVKEIDLKLCADGKVDVSYLVKNRPFERIRRITGYLVGSLEKWNDSKQVEERERVKHDGDTNLPRMRQNF